MLQFANFKASLPSWAVSLSLGHPVAKDSLIEVTSVAPAHAVAVTDSLGNTYTKRAEPEEGDEQWESHTEAGSRLIVTVTYKKAVNALVTVKEHEPPRADGSV